MSDSSPGDFNRTHDMSIWKGRSDIEEIPECALRWHQKIQSYPHGQPPQQGITLIGLASDEGVRRNHGRQGAAAGPDLLRKALANQPWNRVQPVYDIGNIETREHKLEQAQQAYSTEVSRLLSQHQTPVGLGGGHDIAWASYMGLANYLHSRRRDITDLRIGIINFDAHFDLRQPDHHGPGSGTPFWQIAEYSRQQDLPFHYLCLGVSRNSNTPMLFRRAKKLGVHYRMDDELTLINLDNLTRELQGFMGQVDHIYLTIDLDAFPQSQAPGVSAPAARGIPLEVVEPLLKQIRDNGKLRIFDLAEFNPAYDIDSHTARLGARLIHLLTYQDGVP